jgi:hypothetical protein
MKQEQSDRLDRILGSGVPFDAIAFYGRWWEFERWLREMAYVELRAKYGPDWTLHLRGSAPKRAATDRVNEYMASADADDLLAYSDVSSLFALIEAQWSLFEPCLPPLRRWQGITDMLEDLRNRNAHCRRPHQDDLGRIEQTLRDVEPGAWKFYASFASETAVTRNSKDPLAKQWVLGKHETARRLLDHAAVQYDTRFSLDYIVRPWAKPPSRNRISGIEGVIWKPRWIVVGDHEVRPRALWSRIAERSHLIERLIYLQLTSTSVMASFSALDPVDATADAIGQVFDAILETSSRYGRASVEEEDERWKLEAAGLPSRVQAVDSAFNLVDPYDRDAFTLFAAD